MGVREASQGPEGGFQRGARFQIQPVSGIAHDDDCLHVSRQVTTGIKTFVPSQILVIGAVWKKMYKYCQQIIHLMQKASRDSAHSSVTIVISDSFFGFSPFQ